MTEELINTGQKTQGERHKYKPQFLHFTHLFMTRNVYEAQCIWIKSSGSIGYVKAIAR